MGKGYAHIPVNSCFSGAGIGCKGPTKHAKKKPTVLVKLGYTSVTLGKGNNVLRNIQNNFIG